MAERVQSLQKHHRWLPPYHFFVMPVLLVNFLNELRHLIAQQTLHAAWMVVLAAGLLMLGFLSRTQALTVQDRVIRLEMRLRLRGLLPADMHPMINDLTHRQMVALRFASDAELADLVREIREGKLQTSKDIKARIKNWQADWLRA
jgi:Family of unknown function (DUF6526)